MKLDKNKKIELAVSKDGFRGPLQNVYLDVETATLVATDGKKLVSLKVVLDEGDTSGYISPEALKESRKTKAGALQLNCNSVLACESTGKQYARPDSEKFGQFPRVQQVFPAVDRKEIEVILDPSFLLDIAKALGSDKKITLGIPVNGEGEFNSSVIRVTVKGQPDEIGLLMPAIY